MWPLSNKLLAIVAAAGISLSFFSGWKVHGWYYAAETQAAREKAVSDYVEAEKQAAREAAELEADKVKRDAGARKNAKLKEKDIAANPDSYKCRLTDDGLRLINEAITGTPAR